MHWLFQWKRWSGVTLIDGINLHFGICSDTLCARRTEGVKWDQSEQGGGQSNHSLEDSEVWTTVTGNTLLLQNLPSVYYSKIWLLPSVNRYCPGPSYHYLTWITVLTFLLEVSQLPHCSSRTQQSEVSCENVSDPIPALLHTLPHLLPHSEESTPYGPSLPLWSHPLLAQLQPSWLSCCFSNIPGRCPPQDICTCYPRGFFTYFGCLSKCHLP